MRGHPHTHTHTLEKHGGGLSPPPLPPGPDAYELLKTPHRLVRSQSCGIVWVKEEGSWRELEMCASPKVGGGGNLLPPPPFLESGGANAPLAPPFLRLWYKKKITRGHNSTGTRFGCHLEPVTQGHTGYVQDCVGMQPIPGRSNKPTHTAPTIFGSFRVSSAINCVMHWAGSYNFVPGIRITTVSEPSSVFHLLYYLSIPCILKSTKPLL